MQGAKHVKCQGKHAYHAVCVCGCSQVKPSGLEVAIDVAEFDEQWRRVAGQQFSLQDTLFVPHDFAVSESYYIFFYTGSSFELVRPFTICRCKRCCK